MTLTDLLVVAASMIGIGMAALSGYWVFAQEQSHRCLWCSGSGREWGEEHGARCRECAGTGATLMETLRPRRAADAVASAPPPIARL